LKFKVRNISSNTGRIFFLEPKYLVVTNWD
jgi:hypothetical protein